MTLETSGSGARIYNGPGTTTLNGDAGEHFHYITAEELESAASRRLTDAPGLGRVSLESFTPPREPISTQAAGYAALHTAPFNTLLTSVSAN